MTASATKREGHTYTAGAAGSTAAGNSDQLAGLAASSPSPKASRQVQSAPVAVPLEGGVSLDSRTSTTRRIPPLLLADPVATALAEFSS